jgi:hypothetical protein
LASALLLLLVMLCAALAGPGLLFVDSPLLGKCNHQWLLLLCMLLQLPLLLWWTRACSSGGAEKAPE